MDSYRLSKAWHLAHSVAIDVHALARELPKSDHYNIHEEIRIASARVPLTIEASTKKKSHEKLKHYKIARFAATELHDVLMLAREQQYIEKQVFTDLASRTIEAQQLLTSLIRSA
ncbi:MAG: four helix bundle protein [Patescibacteria group bacterium]|nr:four helix bundle protein [Patescibacteria group bacterium]